MKNIFRWKSKSYFSIEKSLEITITIHIKVLQYIQIKINIDFNKQFENNSLFNKFAIGGNGVPEV